MVLKETREMSLTQTEIQPCPIKEGVWWLQRIIETIGEGVNKQHIEYKFNPPLKVILNTERELLICYLGDFRRKIPLLFQHTGQGTLRVMHFRTLDLLEGKYFISDRHMKWRLEKRAETPLFIAAFFVQYPTSRPPKKTKAKDLQMETEVSQTS
ncbi:MAG: hypothetical protein MUC87_13820 [Bacteroidia bacterium]|jgi:hypothetical protein|nr:hypothetical protein [Bacteroidia bacterium]